MCFQQVPSARQPNPALKGTRGYALVFFPYSVRPRPLARALGASNVKGKRGLPSGRVSGLESL